MLTVGANGVTIQIQESIKLLSNYRLVESVLWLKGVKIK